MKYNLDNIGINHYQRNDIYYQHRKGDREIIICGNSTVYDIIQYPIDKLMLFQSICSYYMYYLGYEFKYR